MNISIISLSIVFLIVSSLAAFTLPKFTKNSKSIKPIYILLAGAFLAIFVIMLYVDYKPQVHGAKTTFFLAIVHSIQVLLLGYDFEFLYESIKMTSANSTFAFGYLSFLFLLAPVYTFSFVLSFFENVTAYIKYALRWRREIFILSDLSEKSVTLGKSIRTKFPKALVVFMNASEDAENDVYDFKNNAKSMKAIIFHHNITEINLRFHSKNTRAVFFAMNEDETVNMESALNIIDKFKNRSNTELYVFSMLKEGELLLDSVDTGGIKVRRVSEDRSLAYTVIDRYPITEHATVKNNTKIISALVVGFGGYGSELTKALLWCGQLPGYNLEINVVDQSPDSLSHFRAECPEIFELNGNTEIGEACYNLNFHCGIDVLSYEFYQTLSRLTNTSVVYVCLGDDERNIETAINIRVLLERAGIYPVIYAIVYSNIKYKMLKNHSLINHQGESYNIEIIGNLESRLSYDVIINEELDSTALACHLRWAQNKEAAIKDFNRCEYYRNSSIATAIHEKYREREGLSGEVSEVYEHMRWNAFMRTEGFIFSGSKEKSSRNDRAKMHNNLHRFGLLSDEDIEKDRRIINKNN